jgi:hypothetical protein
MTDTKVLDTKVLMAFSCSGAQAEKSESEKGCVKDTLTILMRTRQ